MDAFIATILLFAGKFAPTGWAFCNGQLLSISQYQALYSLLGTTYGGDGVKTFGLPDLRGRVPVGTGQGIGFPVITLGQQFGTLTNTLTQAQMPMHSHLLGCNESATGRNLLATPTGNFPAPNQDGSGNFAATTEKVMNQGVISVAGGSQPVNNAQPSLGLNYIICLNGIYPTHD